MAVTTRAASRARSDRRARQFRDLLVVAVRRIKWRNDAVWEGVQVSRAELALRIKRADSLGNCLAVQETHAVLRFLLAANQSPVEGPGR